MNGSHALICFFLSIRWRGGEIILRYTRKHSTMEVRPTYNRLTNVRIVLLVPTAASGRGSARSKVIATQARNRQRKDAARQQTRQGVEGDRVGGLS